MAQPVFTWTLHHVLRWDDRLVESQEGLETEVGPRADLISSERSGAQHATEVLGPELLDQIFPKGHMFMFYPFRLEPSVKFLFMLLCKLLITQMSYSAAVDLVAGLGASQVVLEPLGSILGLKCWILDKEGTLVNEPCKTTSSSSSSYSLREIIPEREPIPVIDLSEDESVEGPKMAPVAPGIRLGISIEEDPSEPTSDLEMTPEPERLAPAVTGDMGTFVANSLQVTASPTPIPPMESATGQQIMELREEISWVDALFYSARQAHRQAKTRAVMLEAELGQAREAHAARERDIIELINERDWLRQFIAQFLSTTRDSVDRARDELESRPRCSSSQCPQAE
ncbi:hypothetical protein M9H77_16255 [Catharanthus roseus]|uniref:Uncharacterized protein n=1 Tax=Catharanthus roseus TaxID=4058 RepID=A0ACC0AZD2_CATRO|nr:hypothetical protein M9H77_16255 [Catharanthus roseus]